MSRFNSGLALLACLAVTTSTPAEQAVTPAAPAPMAKTGDTFVSLQVEGCASKCPTFEIYVFRNGLVKFRSGKNTSAKGTQYKNGMPDVYKQISRYLEQSGALDAKAECAEKNAGTSVAIATSMKDAQERKATWSSSCPEQRERGRAVVKVFVNQTGMWRMIHSDPRWWEKYWEDPAMTGREDISQ
jgi:hypothetical protein